MAVPAIVCFALPELSFTVTMIAILRMSDQLVGTGHLRVFKEKIN